MTPLDDLMRRVPAFKEWVPMWARVVSFLFCILVFQCTGGIYLSSVSEMMGATTLMQEDILMAGYASFIGITMIFPRPVPAEIQVADTHHSAHRGRGAYRGQYHHDEHRQPDGTGDNLFLHGSVAHVGNLRVLLVDTVAHHPHA